MVLGAFGPRQKRPHLTIPNHAVPTLSFWPEDVSRADVNDERSRPGLSVVVDAVRAADDPVPVEAIQGKIRRRRVHFQSSPPLVSARPPPRAESLFRVAPADDVAEILGLAAYQEDLSHAVPQVGVILWIERTYTRGTTAAAGEGGWRRVGERRLSPPREHPDSFLEHYHWHIRSISYELHHTLLATLEAAAVVCVPVRRLPSQPPHEERHGVHTNLHAYKGGN